MIGCELWKLGLESNLSDRRPFAETRRLDKILDRLNTAIKAYLKALDPEEMMEC